MHSLRVAGGGQEHAVRAEGQGADAHTPGAREARVTLFSGHSATSSAPRDFTKVTAKEGPRDRHMWGYWYLSYSFLVTPSKHVFKEAECLKGDIKYE